MLVGAMRQLSLAALVTVAAFAVAAAAIAAPGPRDDSAAVNAADR